MTSEEFFGLTIPQLVEAGITVRLHRTRSLKHCGGWFDPEKKEFVVCTGHKDYFQTYLHEYCHFLQWKHRPSFWDRMVAGTTKFFTWLDKKGPPGGRQVAQHLELDCERLALKLIDQYKLEINPQDYAQKANAYLFSYTMTEAKGKWPSVIGLSVYDDNISKLMPKKLFPLEHYNNLNNMPYEAKILMERVYKK